VLANIKSLALLGFETGRVREFLDGQLETRKVAHST
jgi:hypothetical protein